MNFAITGCGATLFLSTLLGAAAAAHPFSSALSSADVAPTAMPAPAPSRPEKPAEVPSQVPVGDLAVDGLHRPTGERSAGPPWPLHYPLASAPLEQSPWGWRYSERRGAWRMHTGVDLIIQKGTPVFAVQKGRVQRVEEIDGYGLTVLIDHGGGWSSLYSHLLKASVGVGDFLAAGQAIALVGESGNASTPHLHLELRQRTAQGTVAVDPTPHLPSAPAAGTVATGRP